MKNVYVGLSGGVDSSVAAALLKEQGYKVTGIYMKNWTTDLPGHKCPWEEDFRDAKRVAVKLGIEFDHLDFQKEYKSKVVDYMIDEYKSGKTPNPDVMCNQEIKFKLFFDTAMEKGVDYVATGHYAKSKDGKLMKADNPDKDQTYFLYRVRKSALEKTKFPLGDFKSKEEVRSLAKKYGLPTAKKKDSQGICFVGQVGIKEFLGQYIKSEPGRIIDQNGNEVGEHDGAIFYTIGQRHGLNIGGGLPFYVTKKDINKNIIYVTTNLDDKNLWSKEFLLKDMHWIKGRPLQDKRYQARLRYQAPLTEVRLSKNNKLFLDEEQRAIAVGQSAVIYDGDECLGGGIISGVC